MDFNRLEDETWGVDRRPEDRPGVPMETEPQPLEGVHWDEPEQQQPNRPQLKSASRPMLTPVFGTAQPPHGVSGLVRRLAYKLPEHRARHWMLLMLADRVEVAGTRLSEEIRRPRTLAALLTLGLFLLRAWRRH